jgi:Uma2 family endonuclease
MTAVHVDSDLVPGIDRGLLDYLDEHEVRYEVIDGSVVVGPAPGFAHGDVLLEVAARLRVAAPSGLTVISDYPFVYGAPSFLIPDFLVARSEDCEEKGIYVPPLLVVEVHSTSTRRRDLTRKREIYAEAGVPTYWVVDPKVPALIVLTLRDGSYVETAQISGNEMLHVEQPFAVDIALMR